MKIISENPYFNNLNEEAKTLLNQHMLLFDIETTGFSADKTSLYLIGCCYMENKLFRFTQFFAENKEDESSLLLSFQELFTRLGSPVLCSFNGNGFDLPYLIRKCEKSGIDSQFLKGDTNDLYKKYLPLKNLLPIENFKQKTLESFLDTGRVDPYNGGELIEVYRNYRKNPNESDLQKLLLHNKEDVLGILSLTKYDRYLALINDDLDHVEFKKAETKNYEGFEQSEICIELTLANEVPVPINIRIKNYQLALKGRKVLLIVPVINHNVRYYYENYKDYWYYPTENLAVHKSAAIFTEKTDRIKATPETASLVIPADDLLQFTDIKKKQWIINQIRYLLL